VNSGKALARSSPVASRQSLSTHTSSNACYGWSQRIQSAYIANERYPSVNAQLIVDASLVLVVKVVIVAYRRCKVAIRHCKAGILKAKSAI
jgi:hypothetical protein